MHALRSKIEAVRVHHQGATVTRWVELPVPLPDEVEISGLPLSLHDASVKVRVVQGDAIASDVRVGLFARPPETIEEPPDERALRAVERAIADLQERRRALADEIRLLGNIPVPERAGAEQGKPPTHSPMAARVALEAFTDGFIGERLAAERALAVEEQAKQEQALDLRDRIARASTALHAQADTLSKALRIRLRAGEGSAGGGSGAGRLAIDYLVPGARWAPQYQVHLSADCRTAHIALRALVCQRSGEDWRGARLSLSTAAPLRFTELPELRAIRIGKAQPPPPARTGFCPAPKGSLALFADVDRDRQRLLAALPAPSPRAFEGALDEARRQEASPTKLELADLELAGAAPAPAAAEEELAVAAPPPAPPAPAPGRRTRTRRPSPKQKRRSEPVPPEAIVSAVAFGALRLAGPTEARRNQLWPVDRRAQYLQALTRSGLRIDFDVLEAVDRSTRHAAEIGGQPLPRGACDVRRAAGRFDFAYDADDRVDVPGDGRFHSIALGRREARCEVRYVVVPRHDSSVYRVASLRNPSEAPMLPGPAEIYVGGEYILSAPLPTVAPRADFELGLGVEQAIKCARNTHFAEARSGEKVVAMTELRHTIEITLANGLSRAAHCEVRERLPQPAEEAEVVVEEGAVRPTWAPYDQEERGQPMLGGRRWQVQVPAGERVTLEAAYVVKIYANNELIGGNRREA